MKFKLKPQDLHLRNFPTSVREKANSNLDGAQESENTPRTSIRGFLTIRKKGEVGNMTMVVAFVFLLIVIGSGIYFGTMIFFSSDYDFREIDAKILNKNIKSCIENFDINWENKDKEALSKEFLSKCRISRNLTEKSFFIQIKSENAEILNLGKGDNVQCGLADKNPKYMKCFNSTIRKNIDNKENFFFIQTGSNQFSRGKIQ